MNIYTRCIFFILYLSTTDTYGHLCIRENKSCCEKITSNILQLAESTWSLISKLRRWCDNRTLLVQAIEQNNPALIKKALLKGVDVNSSLKNFVRYRFEPDLYNHNALEYAATKGNTEMVKLLLTLKANPNIKVTPHATLLNNSCAKGATEIVSLLLEFDANIEEYAREVITVNKFQNSDGITDEAWSTIDHNIKNSPLYYASHLGTPSIVKLLIERGAYITSNVAKNIENKEIVEAKKYIISLKDKLSEILIKKLEFPNVIAHIIVEYYYGQQEYWFSK